MTAGCMMMVTAKVMVISRMDVSIQWTPFPSMWAYLQQQYRVLQQSNVAILKEIQLLWQMDAAVDDFYRQMSMA
jgi:hypothetical protein